MKRNIFISIVVLFSISACNPDEQLLEAVKVGKVKRVQQSIKKGADVNQLNDDNKTLLMIAVQKDDFETANVLIDNGADVNFVDPDLDFSCLAYAVSNRNIEIAELLLKNNANVEKGSGPETPIALAIREKDLNMVKLLLDNNADVTKRVSMIGSGSITYLHVAVYHDALDITNFLLKDGRIDVNITDSFGDHPLNWAAFFGRPDHVQPLLAAGSKLNVYGFGETNAIEKAESKKFDSIVKMMSEAGETSRY